MTYKDLEYNIIKPSLSLADLIESFWMLVNHSDTDKEIIVLPDGRIDLFFSYSESVPFHITLLGLETKPTNAIFSPKTIIFAVSFKLPAIEFIFEKSISDLLDGGKYLPADFWGITKNDLSDLTSFSEKCTKKITQLLKRKIDQKKQKLFHYIYSSKGAMTVKELSEKAGWSSRQINRYFNEQFGVSLKTYCTILRFRASFGHIKEGKLFPDQNFTDQAHFIKEIKKFSGVIPKELAKNKNDRFIQFSTLTKK